MEITRRQLRRLIETRIKPNIPNVPSEELLGRIDNFARDKEMQSDADSFAGAFGYPEDRSYVEDLKTYDAAERGIFDTVSVRPYGQTESEVMTVPIPYELVDKLTGALEDLEEAEAGHKMGDPTTFRALQDAGFKLRAAGIDIFRHIHDHLDGKYGRDNYDIWSYGVEGADGYLADKYEKAMEKLGEHL